MKDVNKAVCGIKLYISSNRTDQSDPTDLKALLWAIDQLGSSRWGDETNPNLEVSVSGLATTTSESKCNYFVAAAYIEGAGVQFLTTLSWKLKTIPIRANDLASCGACGHFVLTPKDVCISDITSIISFSKNGDSGHTSLALGDNLLIYHGGGGRAKVGTFEENWEQHNHGQYTRRVYR